WFALFSPPPAPLSYLVTWEEARDWRGGAGGELRISAARAEQNSENNIALSDMRLWQTRGESGIILEGESGQARRGGENGEGRLEINEARGTLSNAGQTLNIKADEIFYDIRAVALSGRKPEISGESLHLRGDEFSWSAEGGLKVEGNVESSYRR
ncbi:MAG: hypothetical protein ACR2P5_05655, partial [Gammaproteobacteria bacterium]